MESQLRRTAASLIDSLSRLEELERAKRDLEPGSPDQIRLSHEKCVDNPDRSIRLTGQNLSGGMFEIADMQVHQNGSPE